MDWNWIDYAIRQEERVRDRICWSKHFRDPKRTLKALQRSSIKVDNFLEVMTQYDGPSIILRSHHDNFPTFV